MSGRRSGALVAFVLALLCGLVGGVRPAAAEALAVVEESYEGVAIDAQPRFASALEEALRAAGFGVTGLTRVRARLSGSRATQGCTMGPCLRAVGHTLGVELGLSARVVADGQSYTYTLTITEMRSGLPMAQLVEVCEVCTVDEAESALTLAVVALGIRYREARDTSAPAPAPAKPLRTRTWVMAGAALALVATGVALVAAGDSDDSKAWGFAALGSASGLVVGAVLSY